MEPSDLQRHVVGVLERLAVRYFITGSTATIFFGEPRFTNDLDVVADLKPEHVKGLMVGFPSDEFYLSEDAVRNAIAKRWQFNIIHPTSGLKVDVMIPQADGLDQHRFARSVRVRPEPNYIACYSSPEDIIVKKMEFFQEGGSDKHLRDIIGVMKIVGDGVDRLYIAGWAAKLGLEDTWQTVLDRLEDEPPKPI